MKMFPTLPRMQSADRINSRLSRLHCGDRVTGEYSELFSDRDDDDERLLPLTSESVFCTRNCSTVVDAGEVTSSSVTPVEENNDVSFWNWRINPSSSVELAIFCMIHSFTCCWTNSSSPSLSQDILLRLISHDSRT